ncbi:OmpA/MotB domain protein [Geobacter metallireducens RCH3]|uniref:Peptidoglycan-binding outer membrane protein, OMP_b-brl, OmpA and OmpA domain-containing n=1 Tax=Geobacter metallireducens (strain ATCC 53774 / DSM 7210 / GS-15) TaxID=269799 RepID=Q39XK7_GEOMG|nr:OmpA family protein [Geobacter metallireducens]ABB31017.1 peptidoglycan-binding outer membrane protein, OMP_b-brl, OmpA and OmpA domain-containing [Geobacter metallireducens GS-15]EHP86023.1 OmpA/MotB domain protein [Geobacter metallireducens RCH3]
MKRLLAAGCALFALAFATTAMAEVKPGSFAITPYVGGYTFDGEQHIKTGPTFGIRGGYNFTKNCGLEGVFGYTPTEQTKRESDVDAITYRLEGLYHFMPEKDLVPFLAVGGGGITIDSEGAGVKSRTDGIVTAGGGLKYFINEALAVRTDGRYILDLSRTLSNWEYTVGLSFLFGGEKKAVAPVAPAAAPAEATPAPEAPPAVMAAEPRPGLMKYCTDLKIEFDIDKADIRPQYKDEVKRVADYMKQYPNTTAVIEGYTDDVGSDDYNMKLSQRRAEAVVNSLVDDFGIDRSRLSAKGYGKTQPLTSNATEAGKQKNRRIQAVIDCTLEDPKVIAKLPDRLCVSLNIQFDTDKYTIKPQYHDEIAKVGEFMKQNPTTTAVIEGHTDRVGSYDYNMKLSLRRAESVVTYLADKFGIERSRLSAKGYGYTRPIGYNSDPKGRAMNRRINAIIDCVLQQK